MLIRQPPASVAGSLLNVFCVSSLLYYKKKVTEFPVFSRDGCHLQNSPWPGIIKVFPASGSLVDDMRLGTGNPRPFFYSVMSSCRCMSSQLFPLPPPPDLATTSLPPSNLHECEQNAPAHGCPER
jgi:hypothetical protein